MRNRISHLVSAFLCSGIAVAAVPDAVLDFKTAHAIQGGDKVLKWEFDVNGDGHHEVILCLKSDFERDKAEREPPAWTFYVAEDTSPPTYTRSAGTEESTNDLSVDDLPQINPEACFVGLIAELGKRGIVTMRTDHPREGESVGRIYAYTLEGDHLKRTELARYIIAEGPHDLFTKYLAEGKRTVIPVTEIEP